VTTYFLKSLTAVYHFLCYFQLKSTGTQKLKRELKNGDRSDLRASLERAPESPRWLQKKWVGQKSDFDFTFSTPLGKHDFPPPAVGNMLPTAGRVRNPW
jgi:hypothetical protein